METRNFLEDEFRSGTMFLVESIFEPEYMPTTIKHRDNELKFLSRLFIPLITNPFSISKKVLINGNVGVGKTVTIHLFGKMIIESAKKRNLNIQFIHINCRHKKTSSSILKSILNELVGGIPSRGLSSRDFLEILVTYLRDNECYLILVLDELGSILKKDSDLIYTLTRINEINFRDKAHLSLIGIVKNIVSLKNLDDATISSLQNEVIRFKKYTKQQIFDILQDRVEIGLKPGIVDESILRTISSLTSVSGDMRVALNILKNAVRYAEHHHIDQVSLEIIQNVNSKLFPLSKSELLALNKHELILFNSICNMLTGSKSQITLNEVKDEYRSLCDHYGEKIRSETQIWEYIQTLKRNGLIASEIRNQNQRGRQSYISVPNFSVNIIKKHIQNILEREKRGKNEV